MTRWQVRLATKLARQAPRPQTRNWTWWIAVAFAVFAALEGLTSAALAAQPPFWDRARQIASREPLQALFVGNSRVAAAIDEPAFEGALLAAGRLRGRVLNVGRGDTNLRQHYLALRDLDAEAPSMLAGLTIFVEVFSSSPESAPWTDDWLTNDEFADWTATLLEPDDLNSLWRSRTTFEKKAELSIRYLLRWSTFLNRGQAVGRGILNRTRASFDRQLLGVFGLGPQTLDPDLTTAGGIRTDPASIERGIRLAQELAQAASNAARSSESDERTALSDLIELAQRRGWCITFFEMPAHSVWAPITRSPSALRERRQFAADMTALGMSLIAAQFSYEDIDFPDVWHLRASRAPEFSRALANAWLAGGTDGGCGSGQSRLPESATTDGRVTGWDRGGGRGG